MQGHRTDVRLLVSGLSRVPDRTGFYELGTGIRQIRWETKYTSCPATETLRTLFVGFFVLLSEYIMRTLYPKIELTRVSR